MPETLSNSQSLTADDILDWLKANPNFLPQHPEAIDLLLPPKEEVGDAPENRRNRVADFQSYMIARLKADKSEAVETVNSIVETTRSNMNNQARIHKAVLALLEAMTFDEFIQAITDDLTTILDVDITTLVVESNGRDIPHIQTNGIRVVPEGTVDKWMQGKNVLLQSDISGIEVIYGAGATLVRSQSLVRVDVSMHTPPAIIAFGSRDPNLFQPHQGTEQVLFLARVVERLFRAWLLLP